MNKYTVIAKTGDKVVLIQIEAASPKSASKKVWTLFTANKNWLNTFIVAVIAGYHTDLLKKDEVAA